MRDLDRLPALLREYFRELVDVAERVGSCAQNEPLDEEDMCTCAFYTRNRSLPDAKVTRTE